MRKVATRFRNQQAREHPHETLGVIAMGIKHMNGVQARFDRKFEKHPDLGVIL